MIGFFNAIDEWDGKSDNKLRTGWWYYNGCFNFDGCGIFVLCNYRVFSE